MTVWLWLAVAAIGGLAASGRFIVDGLITRRAGGDLPAGTVAVNLTGTLLLGVLTGVGASGNLLLLAGTATLGSYTTFSTWMLETYRLAEDGEPRPAAINAVLSLLLGFGAALLGRTIGLAF
ncbi:MAG: fluoride efflux transporter CrcB [Conexibacteraceae bacterium]|nr:fluoride efflux transporter CrcB [Conexibacteraceae bacterium]